MCQLVKSDLVFGYVFAGGNSCEKVIPLSAKHGISCTGRFSCYDSVLQSSEEGVECTAGSGCSLDGGSGAPSDRPEVSKWGGPQIEANSVECAGHEACLEVESIDSSAGALQGDVACSG